MPVKSYLNFDLLLSEAGDRYQARLLDSPAGQATHTFTLPFSALELENFILKIGQNRSNVRSLHLETVDVPSIQKLGGALYQCLFDEEVAERFRASQAIAHHEGKGLRIRLRLSGAPKLIDIPWELLFDAANNNYVGLSVNTPIIRKLDLATAYERHPAAGVLRVLVMIASPSNYPSLDVEREWERINTATQTLQASGRMQLIRLEPSLAALQRQLRQGEYHVFHYIGHGGFDRQNQDGVLVLQDPQGKGHLVSGQYLGAILYDHATLQLALLNSCSGGRTSITDPFAGVGQSLLQKGIPAIIAMQFEITDEAAITFAHEFYAALADGYPIDAAVAEARKMIYAQANQLEWATPVLYTSTDGGSLLEKPNLPDKPPLPQSTQPPAIKPARKPAIPAVVLAGVATVTVLAGVTLYLFQPPPTDNAASAKVTIPNAPTIPLDTITIEPAMAVIPAGKFMMGCVPGRDDVGVECDYTETPAHEVSLPAFQISQYEVTFAQWDACEQDKACPHADDYQWGRGLQPVMNISWNDITQHYLPWLSQKTGKPYRLPSEAEWEYAARGGKDSAFPWGSSIRCDDANYGYKQCNADTKPKPVGSYAANAYGLYDTVGNVAELVTDCWHSDYQGAPNDGSAWDACVTESKRVVRGGLWSDSAQNVRTVYRSSEEQDKSGIHIGFRLALDF